MKEYTIGIDLDGRAYQLVKDYLLDELRWVSWVETPENGYGVNEIELAIIYEPGNATVTPLKAVQP